MDQTTQNSPGDESGRESSTRRTRVLLLDDHPAVRMGLVQLLQDQPDFDVVAVATNAEAAVSQAGRENVDVAILDYHLGGRNGLWVTRQLKTLDHRPRVVIFSAFANDHLAASCVVAGADALLNKGSLGSELCETIRSLAHGRRRLPKVPATMADSLRRRLDEDEQMIFGMMLAGIPRAEVLRTVGLDEPELVSTEDRMLGKLEALPGELTGSGPGHGTLDFERLIPN